MFSDFFLWKKNNGFKVGKILKDFLKKKKKWTELNERNGWIEEEFSEATEQK